MFLFFYLLSRLSIVLTYSAVSLDPPQTCFSVHHSRHGYNFAEVCYYFKLLFKLVAEGLLDCCVLNYETRQSNRLPFRRSLLPTTFKIASKFLRKPGKHLSSNALSLEEDSNLGRYRCESDKSELRMGV
jgi:hypothetical protein